MKRSKREPTIFFDVGKEKLVVKLFDEQEFDITFEDAFVLADKINSIIVGKEGFAVRNINSINKRNTTKSGTTKLLMNYIRKYMIPKNREDEE